MHHSVSFLVPFETIFLCTVYQIKFPFYIIALLNN